MRFGMRAVIFHNARLSLCDRTHTTAQHATSLSVCARRSRDRPNFLWSMRCDVMQLKYTEHDGNFLPYLVLFIQTHKMHKLEKNPSHIVIRDFVSMISHRRIITQRKKWCEKGSVYGTVMRYWPTHSVNSKPCLNNVDAYFPYGVLSQLVNRSLLNCFGSYVESCVSKHAWTKKKPTNDANKHLVYAKWKSSLVCANRSVLLWHCPLYGLNHITIF